MPKESEEKQQQLPQPKPQTKVRTQDESCVVGLSNSGRPRSDLQRLTADEKKELATIVDRCEPPSVKFQTEVSQFWAKRKDRMESLKATEVTGDQ